jgi:pimeloyl-ACP methyl ester carboxylesterase
MQPALSSSQWRGLMELLAPRFHIFAADTYGAGKSPPWPPHPQIVNERIARFLEEHAA